MKTETISWHQLPADGLPDADTTVMLEFQTSGEPTSQTWPGWWDGQHWIEATNDDRIERSGERQLLVRANYSERQALRAAA